MAERAPAVRRERSNATTGLWRRQAVPSAANRFASRLGVYGLDKPQQVIVVTQKGGISKALQLGGTNGKQVYTKKQQEPR